MSGSSAFHRRHVSGVEGLVRARGAPDFLGQCQRGAAIAIGHPHEATLKLLAQWLAQDHGVTLVPLDEAIRLKAKRQTALAAR